jgi:MFS family permease
MDALIVGRAIAGFGAIGIYIGVLAILSGNTTERERPTYLGFAGAMWGLASVLGPVFGGAFVASAGGWRWVFPCVIDLIATRHSTLTLSSARPWPQS